MEDQSVRVQGEEQGEDPSSTLRSLDWTFSSSKPQQGDELACDESVHPHMVKFYNDFAESYEAANYAKDYASPFYVAITTFKYLNGNSKIGNYPVKILDVGGGTGLAVQELRKLDEGFNNVDVVDPAEKMVKLATERGLYKDTFIQYFYNGCGFPGETYDVVMCAGGFFPGGLQSQCVEEMARVLKPGGLLVIGIRTWFIDTFPALKNFPDELNKLVENRTLKQLENSVVPNYHGGMPGQIFAYSKNESSS